MVQHARTNARNPRLTQFTGHLVIAMLCVAIAWALFTV
jgi:hypothetical protein